MSADGPLEVPDFVYPGAGELLKVVTLHSDPDEPDVYQIRRGAQCKYEIWWRVLETSRGTMNWNIAYSGRRGRTTLHFQQLTPILDKIKAADDEAYRARWEAQR